VTERIWACVRLQWGWLGGVNDPGESGPRSAAPEQLSRAA
jgi:hypothetical protein